MRDRTVPNPDSVNTGVMERYGPLSRSEIGKIAPMVTSTEERRALVRAKLEPFIDVWCEQVVKLVKAGHRTGIARFDKALGLSDPDTVLINVFQRWGARDEADAKALIQEALQARTQDDDVLYLQAKSFCDQYRREHGLPALVESNESREVPLVLEGSEAGSEGSDGV